MDIQALEILSNLAAITTKQGSGDAEVVSGDFSRLLNEINTMQSVSDMQEEICKKFNVTLHVVDYACNTTDQTAENFDLAMLDSGKFYGAGNVVISKKCSKNGSTPKLVNADPKNTGVNSPLLTFSISKSSPAISRSSISSINLS